MITTTKNLVLPVGVCKIETISFDNLRDMQARLQRKEATEDDMRWVDAIISAITTGRLA